MLAVYETIDLGLVSTLSRISGSTSSSSVVDLLQGNHPVFHADPIHDDTIYVYHAFGVHALHLNNMLRSLAIALRGDDEGNSLITSLRNPEQTDVKPIVTTFSVERRYAVFPLSQSPPADAAQGIQSGHSCRCPQ